jgi:UDP:flavonoid glycosyltransferase YjiC (YdhE family)
VLFSTGVPQLILPLWADLYDYAVRVEYFGIGIWGNKRTAPNWTAEELGEALLKMVGDSEEAVEMRRKAKDLAVVSKRGGEGRIEAANQVAKLARRV